ncbi:MAG: beta-ketoacyl synthase N-terminal-like domain-containing protein [Fibrobacterota bacterium]
MSDKTVITGLGAISSLGIGFDAIEKNLADGAKPVTVNSFEEHDFGRDVPAYAVDFDKKKAKELLGRKGLRTKDKATKMLFAAMEGPFKEWLEELPEAERPGLMVGTAYGSVESVGNFITVGERTGPGSVNPRLFSNTVINSATGNANIRYGLKNHSGVMTTGTNSGLDALIWSCDYIRSGYLKSVFAAGLEELSIFMLYGMDRDGSLSAGGAVKPLSTDSDGTLPGEGCAIACVEDAVAAQERGAPVYGTIAGYAAGFDPNGGTWAFNPAGTVAQSVITDALAEAGCTAGEVDFVVCDANGDPVGDEARAGVIASVFGAETPVTSYRGIFGESMGAGGMLDVAAVCADLRAGRVSAAGFGLNPRKNINLVRDTALQQESSRALIFSMSVDGHCSAVVIEK